MKFKTNKNHARAKQLMTAAYKRHGIQNIEPAILEKGKYRPHIAPKQFIEDVPDMRAMALREIIMRDGVRKRWSAIRLHREYGHILGGERVIADAVRKMKAAGWAATCVEMSEYHPDPIILIFETPIPEEWRGARKVFTRIYFPDGNIVMKAPDGNILDEEYLRNQGHYTPIANTK